MAHHVMKLWREPFDKIKSGKKIYELRLFDEKRRTVVPRDTIEFVNVETDEHMTVTVKSVHVYKDFYDLYAALPLDKCGYSPEQISSASPDDMLKYYTPEQIAKYGVAAIEVNILN